MNRYLLIYLFTHLLFGCSSNKVKVYGYIDITKNSLERDMKLGHEIFDFNYKFYEQNYFFTKSNNKIQFYYHNIQGIWGHSISEEEEKIYEETGKYPTFDLNTTIWVYGYSFEKRSSYTIDKSNDILTLKINRRNSISDTLMCYPIGQLLFYEYQLEGYHRMRVSKMRDTLFYNNLKATKYKVEFFDKEKDTLYAWRYDYVEHKNHLPIMYCETFAKEYTLKLRCEEIRKRLGYSGSGIYIGNRPKPTKIHKEMLGWDYYNKMIDSDSLKQVYKIKPK